MSQTEPVRPREQELAWYWSSLLGIYLVAVVLLLSYMLYMLWPPSPNARDVRGRPRQTANRNVAANTAPENANAAATGEQANVQANANVRAAADGDNDDESGSEQILAKVHLFGGRIVMEHSFEVRLLLLVLLAGALGSYIHAATSFIDYVGNRKLYPNWVWWYLLRPFVGMALALVFYFVVRGGFISPQAGGNDMNPFGIAALAGLVGMFSQQATDKLSEVFKTLFRTGPAHGDEKRKDSLLEGTATTETTETTTTTPLTTATTATTETTTTTPLETTATPLTTATTETTAPPVVPPVTPTTETSVTDTSSAELPGDEEEFPDAPTGQTSLVVLEINPNSGGLPGMDTAIISGMNFAEGSTVTFGDKPAARVTVLDANTISVMTPPADAEGPVDVTVTSPDGDGDTLAEGFTYTAGG